MGLKSKRTSTEILESPATTRCPSPRKTSWNEERSADLEVLEGGHFIDFSMGRSSRNQDLGGNLFVDSMRAVTVIPRDIQVERRELRREWGLSSLPSFTVTNGHSVGTDPAIILAETSLNERS